MLVDWKTLNWFTKKVAPSTQKGIEGEAFGHLGTKSNPLAYQVYNSKCG